MRILGLWRVRVVLVAAMLTAGCLIVASVGAGVSSGRSTNRGAGKLSATRALRAKPGFGAARRGFSPSAGEMRASSLRTRHAIAGQAPSQPGAELPWLRRANADTFEAGSGRLMTRIYPYPVNYKTGGGSFAPINTQLVASGSGYAQTANNLGVHLPQSAANDAQVSDATGGLSFGLVGASGNAAASGGAVKFAGALSGVDLDYASLSSGIGWQTSVAASAASQSVSWLVAPSSGLSPKLLRSGVAFETAAGKVAWEFAAPSAHVPGSDRPVPTSLSMQNTAKGVVITVSVAHGSSTRASGAGSRHFAAFDPQLDAPMVIPAATANPEPVVFDGQVVQGISVGLGVQTGDCYLDSGSPDTSYCLGDTNYVGPDDHTLINFDVADSLPEHVQVLQAFASMTLESESSTTAENVGVWQAAQDWNNFATWNSYDGTNNWTTPGGDVTGSEQDYASIGTSGDLGGAFYWNINTSMQGWVDGNPPDVDGLYFAAEAGGSAPNTLGFYTETAAPTNNPYLEVYYEPRMGDYPGAKYDSKQLTDRSSAGVNVGTGNLYVANTDLSDTGINGLNLTIDRDYNNLSSDQDSFGLGWSMSTGADTYIAVPCDPDSTVAYFDGTGNAQSFRTNALTGDEVGPSGLDALLTMNDPGDSFSSSTFSLYFRHSGITETFTAPASQCQKVAQLSSVTDINGNKISYSYNGSGQLTSIVDSYGNASGGVPADHTTTISWSTDGYVSEITDPTGRHYHYYQNGSGQLTEYKDPAGNSTYYSYDSYGNLTQIKTAAGNITNVAYDAGDTNEVTSLTRLVTPTDSTGPTWSYQYAVASGTCPAGNGGTQGTVSDPNLHVSTYCTDDMSRIVMSKDANGNIRSTCYTADGYPGNTVSGLSTMTTTSYNSDDSVTGVQDGGASGQTCNGTSGTGTGPATSFHYPTAGSGVNQYLPDYGADQQTNRTDYIYDTSGNNVTKVKDDHTGDNVQMTYNADGTLATSTDPDNNTTTYSYTHGNLTTVTPATIPSGSGTPLNPIHLSYDSANRVSEISSVCSSGGCSGTGHEVDYTYDDFDRVTQALYKNASGTTVATICYEYDNDGNLTQVSDPSGDTDYVYDGLNRLTSEYLPTGGPDYYNYDPAGNLTSLNVPGGIVIYGYDKANELTSVTDPGGSKPMASMTYDADGNLKTTTYASGASVANTYNVYDQLTQVNNTYKTGTGAIAHLTYSYSYANGSAATGLVQKLTDQANNVTKYTYDTLNQLTEAKTQTSGGTGTTTADYNYSPDAAGNMDRIAITGTAVPNTTTSYAYNPGNETCWSYSGTSSAGCGSPPTGAHTYTYDHDGNQTSNGNGLTATYNALNQTTSITSGGTTTNYTYLGEGQDQITSEGTTALKNDIFGLGASTTGTNSTYYTRSVDGTQLDERTPSGTYNYLYDGTGSVVGLTDSSGHLVKQYAYDPYGNTTSSTGTVTNPFGFQDGYQTASGLYHFGQRFLSPTQAAWTQQDSLNQVDDLAQADRYPFASNDPINDIDPNGQRTTVAENRAGVNAECARAGGCGLSHRAISCIIFGGGVLSFAGGGALTAIEAYDAVTAGKRVFDSGRVLTSVAGRLESGGSISIVASQITGGCV
jgi:RHS repeat-associated protein